MIPCNKQERGCNTRVLLTMGCGQVHGKPKAKRWDRELDPRVPRHWGSKH